MASLIRSSKSGSDWTTNELAAYNISIQSQDRAGFFGTNTLPEPRVEPDILTNEELTNGEHEVSLASYRLQRHLKSVMLEKPFEESAVDDFGVFLLNLFDLDTWQRQIRTHKDIPLLICGEWRHAKTDVCIVDDDGIYLLVQEDKKYQSMEDPVAQLVAEALACFQHNNARRVLLEKNPIVTAIIPGIAMVGTSPMFYKIPVTTHLVDAVAAGIYPPTPTVVYEHNPAVVVDTYQEEGMRSLGNRRQILACYQAFKQYIEWYVL